MKKKLLALGMAAALSLSLLSGCGGDTTPSGDASPSGGGDAPSGGKVYYLNFKPEQDAQWQELAQLYTEETGVEVTVLTAASGNYETTLKSEMAKTDAPPCSRSTALWAWLPGRTTATICPAPRWPAS